jgi:hypothetical protein
MVNPIFLAAVQTDPLTDVPRRLVSVVFTIVRYLRERADAGTASAARAEWLITTAWGAVLDGYIADLREHLAGEGWARGR